MAEADVRRFDFLRLIAHHTLFTPVSFRYGHIYSTYSTDERVFNIQHTVSIKHTIKIAGSTLHLNYIHVLVATFATLD
jgi:hypothetical protein